MFATLVGMEQNNRQVGFAPDRYVFAFGQNQPEAFS